MSEFAAFGVEAGYLVPTETGLSKGILDAHAPLRDFLRIHGVHDYGKQAQEPGHKLIIPAEYLTATGVVPTKVSLYRPQSKQGDPRIWLYGLGDFARPGNLLALLAWCGKLSIANLSDPSIMNSLQSHGSPLRQVVTGINRDDLSTASELLEKVRLIADRGYIRSMRNGPTGIGFTLESLLGIGANSRQAPDYKGIELKAQRRVPSRDRSGTRVTLFSKTPDWASSRCGNGRAILERHGYPGRIGPELYVTVTNRPNPQGLHLKVTEAGAVECRASSGINPGPVVQWPLETLEAKLREKHQSTFWVVADTVAQGGVEYFHYRQVVHSQGPLTANFGPLIDDGTVTMDFTLSLRASGATRDHGYLFKIWPESRHLLIPQSQTHVLEPRRTF
ncbi:MvaI/BcnI family restriction endonuclease [Pedococcus sp. P5_B7]